MEFIVVVLLVCGTVVWMTRMIMPLLTRGLDLAEKRLSILEQDITKPSPPKPEAPPADLVSMALGEATPWAQEDALRRLHELYADIKDWGVVRNHYLGEMSK